MKEARLAESVKELLSGNFIFITKETLAL